MKRKIFLSPFFLAAVFLVGSFVNFYASNLVFSDVSNMFYGAHDVYFISSIAPFLLAADFVLLSIYLLRRRRYPQYGAGLDRLYSLLLLVFSAAGVLSSILTGAVIYPSFFSPYPFPGCTLIALILHAGLLCFAVFSRIRASRAPADGQEAKKMSLHYVLYSAILALALYYAMYKFGAILYMPVYAQMKTLSLTFPFYLSLLCPAALAAHVAVYFYDGYRGREKSCVVAVSIIGLVSVALSAAVLLIGMNSTLFIAVISPALPLERLATLPLDTVSQLLFSILFDGYYLFYAIRAYRLAKK